MILMLGTNDTKAYFNRTPLDIAPASRCHRLL